MGSIEINGKVIGMFVGISLCILYLAYSLRTRYTDSSPIVKRNEIDWKTVTFQDIPSYIVEEAKSVVISKSDIKFAFQGVVSSRTLLTCLVIIALTHIFLHCRIFKFMSKKHLRQLQNLTSCFYMELLSRQRPGLRFIRMSIHI